MKEPTIQEFASVNVDDLAALIEQIPTHQWRRMADPTWMRVAEHGYPVAKLLMKEHFPECEISGLGMFVLDPGQEHPEHRDEQPPEWITRVHVPVITNAAATATTAQGTVHMKEGTAYKFNTREPHAVCNFGTRPRVHLIFDVRKASKHG